jgi:flavin reductase (DIM6/NTAB) family NADH-FMN oxidoreductase RutF
MSTTQRTRLDMQTFRNVMGHFAAGVTVVTAHAGGEDFGLTASAVTSVSAEPPMLLVCLSQSSRTQAAVSTAGWFAVNVLDESQAFLATRFGGTSTSKFDGLPVGRGLRDIPVITEALAHLQCRVVETVEAGTHLVVLGEIEAASARPGHPLVHYRGRLSRLSH